MQGYTSLGLYPAGKPRGGACAKEHGVVIRNDILFTLMPQQDRRQQPDRRAAWRGSRRAADIAFAKPMPAHGALMLWTAPPDQIETVLETRIVN
jgi:hypothetical protein